MSLQAKKVFISYRSQPEDSAVAEAFYHALQAQGFDTFMAAKSIRLGENWAHKVNEALNSCDYFLVLLSESSAVSEMVIEEVRHIKAMQDKPGDEQQDGGMSWPVILPIRLKFPMSCPLNYDLRSYLQRIQQVEWNSEADTANIVEQIVSLHNSLSAGQAPATPVPASPTPAVADANTAPSPADEQQAAMPMPMAEPELPGGDQVDLSSSFYIDRAPNEQLCFEAIEKPGALIRIKAPRQMGKTSLTARVLKHATDNGAKVVPVSFQMAENNVLSDLDKFLRWLCAIVSRRLRISTKQLNESWDPIFGSKDNCTAYFEDFILSELDSPIVLALDGVDRVFAYPEVAEDFLGLLRFWHEESKTNDLWRSLSMIVVHSTEVYIPMNINQSPFNVGLSIALPELNEEQMTDLATRHGLAWSSEQVQLLIKLVGGHPYLARVIMYHLCRNTMSWEEIVKNCATDQGPFADHLKKLLWELEHHQDLSQAFKQVLASKTPIRLDSESAFKLQSMGLVLLTGNDVEPRCELYRNYFSDRLSSS